MRRIAFFIMLMLAAGPAEAAVRTLFVGIDTYAFSAGKPGNSDPGFHDLQGPVNDVIAVRDALAGPRGGLALAPFDPLGPCPDLTKPPPPSITLVNQCATRAAIIAALTGQITAASPGDTLLFYYSGHGSQARDRLRIQPGGKNSTMVPADARGGQVHDIIDADLGRMIDAAVARGVNVVTLFDSCDSGTITRDLRGGVERYAPAETSSEPGADVVPPPPVPGVAPGYRVHLSAAADGESALERDGHGVFTTALAAAITSLDAPSYADIAVEVRRQLNKAGELQTPGSEGATTSLFLGSSQVRARIFRAETNDAKSIQLGAGTLAGVTNGSHYTVFATGGAAARGDKPLAEGVIDGATPGGAVLRLTSAIDADSIAEPWVRETVHAYGAAVVKVGFTGSGSDRSRLVAALKSITAVTVVDAGPDYRFEFASDAVHLRDVATGADVGVPMPRDARLDAALTERGRALANVGNLLALATPNSQGQILLTLACADHSLHPALEKTANGEPVAHVGDVVTLTMVNGPDGPRYAYLFDVDAGLGISPFPPEPVPLQPLEALDKHFGLSAPGRDRLLLLLTDTPVALDSLQQDSLSRGLESPPKSQLETLLQAARAGRATRELTPVTAWEAVIQPLTILPAQGEPVCKPWSC